MRGWNNKKPFRPHERGCRWDKTSDTSQLDMLHVLLEVEVNKSRVMLSKYCHNTDRIENMSKPTIMDKSCVIIYVLW